MCIFISIAFRWVVASLRYVCQFASARIFQHDETMYVWGYLGLYHTHHSAYKYHTACVIFHLVSDGTRESFIKRHIKWPMNILTQRKRENERLRNQCERHIKSDFDESKHRAEHNWSGGGLFKMGIDFRYSYNFPASLSLDDVQYLLLWLLLAWPS